MEGGTHDLLAVVDDIDAVIWEADPSTWDFTYVSAGAERMLGYALRRWYEPAFWERHLHADDRPHVLAKYESAVHLGASQDFECRVVAADGTARWVRNILRVARRPDGVVTALRGVLVDRTVQRRADDVLRDSEQRFRAVFEATSSGIVLVSLEGVILSANPAAAQMLGYVPADVQGRSVLEYVHPDEHGETGGLLRAAVERGGRAFTVERRCMHRDGRVVSVILGGCAVSRPVLREPYIVVQLHDISERKILEDRLHQAQRLEAIGRLAGGVAHDFNNLLLVVRSYATLIAEGMHPDDPRRTDLSEIRAAADAGAELTRQLLAFSRQQVIEPRVVALESQIANLERLLARLISEDVTLVTRLAEPWHNIRMDPGQLEQVVVNLSVNARDAMPDGGTLTITTAGVDLDVQRPPDVPVHASGPHVLLTVSDTGIGMDEGTRARIFEPFFTTKAGKGTGLGLATVYGIVKQNQGFIYVDSAPGRGATFCIYLPVVQADVTRASGTTSAGVDPAGAETVLLVEDATPVRSAIRQSLERFGYRVIEAASPEVAIDVAARHEGEIHLLLTDVVMPGLNGRDVAERIGSRRPGLRVLFMSGYTDDTIVRHGVLEPGINYIEKPFSPLVLARKVRSVLDAS